MGAIITRTNGIVTQVWEDNDASWSFFIGRMSNDIKWHHINGREFAKVFRDFGEAKWYLDQRKKRLSIIKRREDDEWEYHILTEVDNVHHRKD